MHSTSKNLNFIHKKADKALKYKNYFLISELTSTTQQTNFINKEHNTNGSMKAF